MWLKVLVKLLAPNHTLAHACLLPWSLAPSSSFFPRCRHAHVHTCCLPSAYTPTTLITTRPNTPVIPITTPMSHSQTEPLARRI